MTQTEAKQNLRASSQSLATSSWVALGLSRVWSTMRATEEACAVGWQTAMRSAPRALRVVAVAPAKEAQRPQALP